MRWRNWQACQTRLSSVPKRFSVKLDGEKQVQRQQMEKVKEPEENVQMNFVSASNHAVTEKKLKRVDLKTPTPIEALNILYELKVFCNLHI